MTEAFDGRNAAEAGPVRGYETSVGEGSPAAAGTRTPTGGECAPCRDRLVYLAGHMNEEENEKLPICGPSPKNWRQFSSVVRVI